MSSKQLLFGSFDETTGKLLDIRQNRRDGRTAVLAPLLQTLSDATGAELGYTRRITAENFGINWIRRPVDFARPVDPGTGDAARNDNGTFSKYGGTECAGWVRMFFSLAGLYTGSSTTMVIPRALDLRYVLQFWHGLGKKVLLCLDGPVSGGATEMNLWRDRVTQMLQRVPENDEDFIDAIEPANEPIATMSSYARLAELMRVTHTLFKALSPRTIICTPCFQGGETAAVEPMLAASAAGVTCRGSTGAGTRGEQFFDVIAYHPYGVATTVAGALANFSQPATERTIKSYSTWIQTAVANRRLATDGGAAWWAARPDPEYWATELNVYFSGSQPTSNAEFRMQALTPAQRQRMIQALVIGCFASGYSKVFPYAPDHVGDIGPWAVSSFATGANGDIRITGGDAVPVFDGDVLLLRGGSMPYGGGATGIAYNASSNGLAYDVAGIPAGSAPATVYAKRYLLGGWHQEWPAVQQSVTGLLEAGFVATADGPVPQVRVDRGDILRGDAGQLQVADL